MPIECSLMIESSVRSGRTQALRKAVLRNIAENYLPTERDPHVQHYVAKFLEDRVQMAELWDPALPEVDADTDLEVVNLLAQIVFETARAEVYRHRVSMCLKRIESAESLLDEPIFLKAGKKTEYFFYAKNLTVVSGNLIPFECNRLIHMSREELESNVRHQQGIDFVSDVARFLCASESAHELVEDLLTTRDWEVLHFHRENPEKCIRTIAEYRLSKLNQSE